MSQLLSGEEALARPGVDAGEEDESPPLDALELEMRRLPGVVGVGWRRGEVFEARLAVGGFGLSALRTKAVQLARGHMDEPLAIELSDVEGVFPSIDADAVRLIDVLIAGGEVEVRVGVRNVVGSGRAGTGPEGAALATVRALDEIGIAPSIQLKIASTVVLPFDLGLAVVVVVTKSVNGAEYQSVSYAASVEESAAKAVLQAYELCRGNS